MLDKILPGLLSGAEIKTSTVAVVTVATTLVYLVLIGTTIIYAYINKAILHVPEYAYDSLKSIIAIGILGMVGNGGVSILKDKVQADIGSTKGEV